MISVEKDTTFELNSKAFWRSVNAVRAHSPSRRNGGCIWMPLSRAIQVVSLSSHRRRWTSIFHFGPRSVFFLLRQKNKQNSHGIHQMTANRSGVDAVACKTESKQTLFWVDRQGESEGQFLWVTKGRRRRLFAMTKDFPTKDWIMENDWPCLIRPFNRLTVKAQLSAWKQEGKCSKNVNCSVWVAFPLRSSL